MFQTFWETKSSFVARKCVRKIAQFLDFLLKSFGAFQIRHMKNGHLVNLTHIISVAIITIPINISVVKRWFETDELPNIQQYCLRVREQLWPDWEQKCSS